MKKGLLTILAATAAFGIASAQPFYLRGSFSDYTPDVLLTDNGDGTFTGKKTGLNVGWDYTYKVANEDWSIQQPGPFQDIKTRANDLGEIEVIFYNNPTPADGWLPEGYRVGLLNLTFNNLPKRYVLIGSFPQSNWSVGLSMDQDPITGVYTIPMILDAGVTYENKFAGEKIDEFSGVDWGYDVGAGFAYNAGNVTVTPTMSGRHLYQVDILKGRYRVVADFNRTLNGQVTLEAFGGDPSGRPVTVEIYQGDTLVDTTTATLDSMGNFAIGVNAGTGEYDVRLKPRGFLSRSGHKVLFDDREAYLKVTTLNADIDNDDAVTVFDYNVLSDYFDRTSEDADWTTVGANGSAPADADLDGDGAVTVFDYNILSANFDLIGDA